MSKKNKKGGQQMAQEEKKRVEQEQDELQKQQDQVEGENLDDESPQDEEGDGDQKEEKTPLIQRIKIGALKVLKILIKWVIKPLAIAIVVFASAISLIVNLGSTGSEKQDDGDDANSDPSEDDIPEEEFEDSDQDGEDQVE